MCRKMQNDDKGRGLGLHLVLKLIYWQVMNHMVNPQACRISRERLFILITEDALRYKHAHPPFCRNSNDCIICGSLVVLLLCRFSVRRGRVNAKFKLRFYYERPEK